MVEALSRFCSADLDGWEIVTVAFQVYYFPNTSVFPFPIVNGGIVDSHQGVEP